MGKIKVLVADSNFLSRKGLEYVLNHNNDTELVAEACNTEDLFECLTLHQPHLLIIDFASAPFQLESVMMAVKKLSQLKVLAITAPQSQSVIAKALNGGVISYLLKECDKEEITEAIYKTVKGEKFLCGKIVDILTQEASDKPLASVTSCDGIHITDREMEIIKLIAEGHSNKQIADILFLSTHTVTTHRKNIMNKLGVNNTAGLVLYAVKNNIIGPNKFLFSSVN